jgi:hypothetical protein
MSKDFFRVRAALLGSIALVVATLLPHLAGALTLADLTPSYSVVTPGGFFLFSDFTFDFHDPESVEITLLSDGIEVDLDIAGVDGGGNAFEMRFTVTPLGRRVTGATLDMVGGTISNEPPQIANQSAVAGGPGGSVNPASLHASAVLDFTEPRRSGLSASVTWFNCSFCDPPRRTQGFINSLTSRYQSVPLPEPRLVPALLIALLAVCRSARVK